MVVGPSSLDAPTVSTSAQTKDDNINNHEKWFTVILLCFLFVHFHGIVYVEGSTGSYVAPFAVKYLGWSNRMGALIASVFQGALGLGRLCNIGVAAVLSPSTMLIMNLTATLCCYILMCFVEYNDVIIWISVAMAGFFQSSTIPTSVLWASGYMRVGGFAACVFVFGAASAAVVYPILVGGFFDTGVPMNMVYMVLTVCFLQIIIFTAMQLFARHKSKKTRAHEDGHKTTEDGI